MRTVRNAMFVVLCALVWAAPGSLLASDCDVWEWGECGPGGTRYQGDCESCTGAFEWAQQYCGSAMMTEYYCGGSEIRFCCVTLIID